MESLAELEDDQVVLAMSFQASDQRLSNHVVLYARPLRSISRLLDTREFRVDLVQLLEVLGMGRESTCIA